METAKADLVVTVENFQIPSGVISSDQVDKIKKDMLTHFGNMFTHLSDLWWNQKGERVEQAEIVKEVENHEIKLQAMENSIAKRHIHKENK